MEFKEKFLALEPKEFEITLKENRGLSLPARNAVKEILEDRGLTDTEYYTEILEGLEEEQGKIQSYKYLKNMGFVIRPMDDRIEVRRYGWSKFIDLFGILLGFLFTLSLVSAIQGWKGIIDNGLTAGGFFGSLLMTVLGIVGAMLLTRSLIRWTEFRGFRLVIGRQKGLAHIEFFKRVDWKKRQWLLQPDHIQYEEGEDSASLVADTGEEKVTIFKTEGAFQTRETLKLFKTEYLS